MVHRHSWNPALAEEFIDGMWLGKARDWGDLALRDAGIGGEEELGVWWVL